MNKPINSDKTLLATFVILLTVFALAFGDAVIKYTSANFTLWQIFTLRSIVVLPILILVIKFQKKQFSIWPRQPGWTILRSLLLTFMWVFYYSSLPHIDLSIAAATYYTLPLFITLFAAYFIGDKISQMGWLAVFLGFIGILLILQPDANQFNGFALLPIISAIFYALAMILTRTYCRNEDVFVLSLWLNITMLVIGAIFSIVLVSFPVADRLSENYPFMLSIWTSINGEAWMAIGILSITIIIGSVGTAIAYQIGRSAVVATFDFAYVPFAALWGFLLFQEIPDYNSVLGAILITIAGILSARK
ncbi:MAG: DMT family transporter [Cyanobacteria bacterium P01_F01_bin.150]